MSQPGGGLYTDAADREAMLRALAELRAILDHAPMSMAIVGMDGTIEYINKRAIETFGYQPEDIPNMQRWWEQAYPNETYRADVVATWMRLMEAAIAEGREIEGREYRATCKDGTEKIMYILGVPVANKIFVMFEDVTENRQAQEALAHQKQQLEELNRSLQARVADRTREQQRTYEQLTNLSRLVPGLLYQFQMFPDGRSCMPYSNEVLEDYFGVTHEEIARDAACAFAVVDPEDYEPLMASILESARTLQPWHHEFRVNVPGRETRWYSCKSQPQSQPDGSILWHGFISDISERKRVEEALRIAKDAAEAATRAKSQFLANMSHEIRTPMNAVMGFTGLVLESELTPEQREYLMLAQAGSKHLLLLMNDLLDLSKIEAERLVLTAEPFDPAESLMQVQHMFAQGAREKGLSLGREVAADVPRVVVGDPRRLRQVLVNLLGNAVKFTPRGDITASVECLREGHAAPPTLYFRVKDTGTGIRPEMLEDIFQPFTQAEETHQARHGGAGLGLPIARRLVELMGGRLWVESELGRGSTFHFTVTLEEGPKHESPGGPKGDAEATAASGLRVLVVEDDPISALLISAMLERQGHRVAETPSGREAISMLSQEDFDLVLMDVQILDIDGLETTRLIRDASSPVRDHAVPIIAVTAQAMSGDEAACLEAGMDAYLSKPVRMEMLAERIGAVVAKSRR